MLELKTKELESINGGISFGWIAAGIVAGVSFIVGVISGYTNPKKCYR